MWAVPMPTPGRRYTLLFPFMARRSLSLATLLVILLPLAASLLIFMLRGTPPSAAQPPTLPSSFRIISLSPALTDILIDLGLADAIVGRDQFETQLDPSIPRIGDLTNLDLESVLALEPSDLLFQAGGQGLPPRLTELAQSRHWNIINVQIDSLDDLSEVISALPAQLTFAGAPDRRPDAESRAVDFNARLDAALAPLPPEVLSSLRPVLLLYGLDPPSAFGPGSYLSDILSRLGASNALTTGLAWQTTDVEHLLTLNPWAVLLVRDSFADPHVPAPPALVPRIRTAMPADFGPLSRVSLSAFSAGRVVVLEHPQALLPGTSIIEVAQLLRSALTDLAQPTSTPPASESDR